MILFGAAKPAGFMVAGCATLGHINAAAVLAQFEKYDVRDEGE
jgi:hypothetical protein